MGKKTHWVKNALGEKKKRAGWFERSPEAHLRHISRVIVEHPAPNPIRVLPYIIPEGEGARVRTARWMVILHPQLRLTDQGGRHGAGAVANCLLPPPAPPACWLLVTLLILLLLLPAPPAASSSSSRVQLVGRRRIVQGVAAARSASKFYPECTAGHSN